ncbi:unnamed protein product, partial [Hapterophycus canaliculatus]
MNFVESLVVDAQAYRSVSPPVVCLEINLVHSEALTSTSGTTRLQFPVHSRWLPPATLVQCYRTYADLFAVKNQQQCSLCYRCPIASLPAKSASHAYSGMATVPSQKQRARKGGAGTHTN